METETPGPFYTPKFPLYNKDGNVIWIMFYQKNSAFIHLCDFFNDLSPSVITLDTPDNTFNEKELDIIFYMLHRMDEKKIANSLYLSLSVVKKILNTVLANSV
ncbi:hypothetical protein BG74_04120 [Sodalis-like endosymbiont of Proechinophthirus fluctus]|nr:hypothetical protein BG74_04120 [Sodalis-like endosymbiont of Proechinophthirus fluctus]